jgi:hypothetical protein
MICPCDCGCHTSDHYPNKVCGNLVSKEDLEREELGPHGQYVCGWCYDICEGIE